MNEAGLRRDNLFIKEQMLAGTALAALGSAIDMILREDESAIDRLTFLENLIDAGICLTQVHHQISSARKAFIAPVLTKSTKELLSKTKPGVHLFGEKLGEILNSAKTMERIGKDIKQQYPSTSAKKVFPRTDRSLNWKGPYPRQGTSYQGQGIAQPKVRFARNVPFKKYPYGPNNKQTRNQWKAN